MIFVMFKTNLKKQLWRVTQYPVSGKKMTQ